MSEPMTDWVAWHQPYGDPASGLSARRRIVQGHVGDWLDALPGSGLPARVLSACAGDGLDVLGVLAGRPEDAAQVDVLLVELDSRLAAAASAYVEDHGLPRVSVRVADAGRTAVYRDHVPAGLLLFCGVFGNVTDDDVRATIGVLPSLCAPAATVLWTRGRDPDGGLGGAGVARAAFERAGFEERAFAAPDDATFGVGAHRLVVTPPTAPPADRLFDFVR